MPELPEAEVAARQLRERVVGATVRDCWIGREDIVREGLPSLDQYRQAKIAGVERKGKSVILHSLVRVAQTLHAMTNSWNRPMVFLHVGQEFVDRHLVIDSILKEPPGISNRTAEARTNHNHARGN